MKFVLIIFVTLASGEWQQGPAAVFDSAERCAAARKLAVATIHRQATRDPRLRGGVVECFEVGSKVRPVGGRKI